MRTKQNLSVSNITNTNAPLRLMVCIRGVPGAGKSTVANMMRNAYFTQGIPCEVIESDDYFTVDGRYQFDSKKIADAIASVHARTRRFCETSQGVVILSNVFTQRRQMCPLFDIARQNDYTVQILTVESQFESVHGVPKTVIEDIRRRFEA